MDDQTAEDRAEQMLASPAGCTLLLTMDENNAPATDLRDPVDGMLAIVRAVGEISPWNGHGHDRILRTVFEYRDAHRDRLKRLALDIFSQPGIGWMWADVDRANQLWLPQESGWVSRFAFESGRAGTTGDWMPSYAHEPWPLLTTSNRIGEHSPELLHILRGMGDWNLQAPFERRRVTIEPDARILTIATPQDWHDFVLRYPADGFRDYRDRAEAHRYEEGHPWGYAPGLLVPDWRAAAEDWDGVHLSPWAYLTVIQVRVESEAGWTEPWSWEGPHTVWLNWVFDEVEELPSLWDDLPEMASDHWMPKALNFSDPAGWLMQPASSTPTPMGDGWFEPTFPLSGSIVREPFGEVKGRPVEKITLSNTLGASISVLTLGVIIQSLTVPDREGNLANIALGFSDVEGYLAHLPALMGSDNIEQHVWTAETVSQPEFTSITLRPPLPQGQEPQPASVDDAPGLSVHGFGNGFVVSWYARTGAESVVPLAFRTWFNLAGEGNGDVLGHALQLRASHYLPLGSDRRPTGERAPVGDTPFDFTEAHLIGERVASPRNEQLGFAGGYDHGYVLDTADELGFIPSHHAQIADPVSRRVMDVRVDQPAVQFATGNHFDGSLVGPGGGPYLRHGGFRVEPLAIDDDGTTVDGRSADPLGGPLVSMAISFGVF